MKIRISNDKKESIKIVLEPWATEYILASNDFIDFISSGEASEDGYFHISEENYGLIVTPEGNIKLVHAINSNGELID